MNIYLRILNYIRPYWLTILLSLISSILFVFLNAFSFWMISSLISTIMNPNSQIEQKINSTSYSIYEWLEKIAENLIGHGDQLEQLKMLCIILIIIFILKNIFFMINKITLSYVGNKINMDIRNHLFSHLQKLPLSFFNKNKSGALSSIIMNDVNKMKFTFAQSIQSLINDPINILFMIIILFIINIKMTIYVLLAIPVTAFIISKLGQSIRRKSMRSSIQIADLMNIFQETISGIRIVKAFIMEKFEIKKFLNENKKYFQLTFKQENMNSLTIPINDIIGISLGVMLLWIGGKEVIIYKNLDPDGFIKYIIFLFAMLQPAKKIGAIFTEIQSGLASAERVFDLINIESNIKESKNPKKITKLKKLINFNNVSFKYEKSNKQILKNININIKRGSTLALVGESGSGKSTFIDLIPRFYEVNQGEILIDNINIREISIQNLRSLMGIVSQDTILFNNTINYNIKYGSPNANNVDIKNAAEAANAFEFINNLPNGFNTIIGERGTRLSGGQKQRLSIARAILKNPQILILDEATSSLDTNSERKVQIAIDNLVQNRTVIVIAHRLSTILNADQIAVLDGGELIELGTHNELLLLNGKYKNLYDIQFGNNK